MMSRNRLVVGVIAACALGLSACGGSAPTTKQSHRPVAAATATAPAIKNLVVKPNASEASLTWELSSSTNVLHILIEQKLGSGNWTKYPELPPTARAETLHNLPAGPIAFRVWAVVKQGSKETSSSIPAPPPPPPVEPPPTPTPPATKYAPGLNAGYWGSGEPPDLKSVGITYVRLDTPPSIAPWTNAGLKVIADESGPYSSSGVSGVNVKSYVERVVAFVKANPQVYAIEVLNEPGGSWFWGSSSESSVNRSAYASLIIAVHDALVSNFGAARPKLLASYDGGHDSSNAWGEAWTQNATALADADALTLHPYGGTGTRSSAILGNRGGVEAAEVKTHKPIDITEVGFPTKGPTGDSLQYTESEQASAIVGFNAWAKSRGYVELVTFYGYRDGEPGGGYGVETHEGKHKLAFGALTQAASE